MRKRMVCLTGATWLLIALSISGCEVTLTKEGEMPEVEVPDIDMKMPNEEGETKRDR